MESTEHPEERSHLPWLLPEFFTHKTHPLENKTMPSLRYLLSVLCLNGKLPASERLLTLSMRGDGPFLPHVTWTWGRLRTKLLESHDLLGEQLPPRLYGRRHKTHLRARVL